MMAVDRKATNIVAHQSNRVSDQAVFEGTDVPVETLVDWLKDGASIDYFLANYSSVRREQVIAALQSLRNELLLQKSIGARSPAMDILRALLVTRNPEIHSGDAVFAGTRVPVVILVDWLEDGASIDFYLANYPSVRREQAVAVLTFLHEVLLRT